MRETFEHCRRIEVPQWTPVHHVQTKGAKDDEVHCCVDLFHESCHLASASDSTSYANWANELLHQKLSGKTQHYYVKGDKSKVQLALAVHGRSAGVLWWQGIGEEDGVVQWVALIGVDHLETEDGEDENQRYEPCILD